MQDYHVVDYDAVTMLNVSATQALHQKVQQQESQIAQLVEYAAKRDAEIASLKKQMETVNDLAAEVAALKKTDRRAFVPVTTTSR